MAYRKENKQRKTCSAYTLNAPTPTWFTFTTEIITARKGYKHYSQCYCPDPEYHSDPHQWVEGVFDDMEEESISRAVCRGPCSPSREGKPVMAANFQQHT